MQVSSVAASSPLRGYSENSHTVGLVRAIQKKKLRMVRTLLLEGDKLPHLEGKDLSQLRYNVVDFLISLEGTEEKIELIQKLMDAGLDITTLDDSHCVGLHYFLERAGSLQDIWSYVLENLPPEQFEIDDCDGRSALHYLSYSGTLEQVSDVFKRLHKRSHWYDSYGLLPYHYSAKADVVKAVLEWMSGSALDDPALFSALVRSGISPAPLSFLGMTSEDRQFLLERFENVEFENLLSEIIRKHEEWKNLYGDTAADPFLEGWHRRISGLFVKMEVICKKIAPHCDRVLQLFAELRHPLKSSNEF